MQIQAASTFHPAKSAGTVRFAHKPDHTCTGDTCSLPKKDKETIAKKPEGNWFVRTLKSIINWIWTFITGPFKDLSAVHKHLVKSSEPLDHDAPSKEDGGKKAGHHDCGHDHDHDDAGHKHGPNCKH